MDISVENVTPTRATAWLNFNKSNRRLRDGVVERYAEDMRNGRWTTCPVPISFYEDGDVADGQHRLWAIVESGCAQKFPVVRGLSRGDGLNIDTGVGRSLVDNAKISRTDDGLTNELIAVCRGIADGVHARGAYGNRTRTNGERMVFIKEHREAAEWVCANGPKGKGIRNAVVLAAMGRAWYYPEVDRSRLRRFADVLSTGFFDGEGETAAQALRNYILQKDAITSQGLWRDTFLKAQNAIAYFGKGKKLTVIKGVSDEAFPLLTKGRKR